MAAPKKSAHLIFSPGFALQLLKALITLSLIAGGAWRSETVRLEAEYVYDWISFQLMQGAHQMAWWTVIGLLSSSCCALQLLLNVFSLGCAGFNTVLGPMRPFLMACTIMLQVSIWSVAYSRPYQWKVASGSSALCAVVMFLPEMLYAFSYNKTQNGDISKAGFKVKISLRNLGCIACVNKVKGVLNACQAVKESAVSIEEGIASICLAAHSASEAGIISQDLIQQINGAGFPAELASFTNIPLDGIIQDQMAANISSDDIIHDRAVANISSDGVIQDRLKVPYGSDELLDSGSCASILLDGVPHGVWCKGALSQFTLSSLAGLLSSSCCLLQLCLNLLSMLNIAHVGCAGFNKVLWPASAYCNCKQGVE